MNSTQPPTQVASDSERAIKTSLENFETHLATPIVGGELVAWFERAKTTWDELSAQVCEQVAQIHPKQYHQISKEDLELMPRVEKLREKDEELNAEREAFDRTLRRIADHAPKFEPEEERIRAHVMSLVDEGFAFVKHVRQQEVAVQTWFMEAFTRDRGVAD